MMKLAAYLLLIGAGPYESEQACRAAWAEMHIPAERSVYQCKHTPSPFAPKTAPTPPKKPTKDHADE